MLKNPPKRVILTKATPPKLIERFIVRLFDPSEVSCLRVSLYYSFKLAIWAEVNALDDKEYIDCKAI